MDRLELKNFVEQNPDLVMVTLKVLDTKSLEKFL